MNRQIEAQIELLETAVNAITDSEEYRRYLKVMSRFPTYSIRNTMLIYAQNPNATFVAGYRAWQTLFGRHVRKGEKGIRILAPYSYVCEDETEGTRKTRTGFRSISVFDISQTEGTPLPDPVHPSLLTGRCSLFEQHHQALERLSGFTIHRCDLPDGLCGRCLYSLQTIEISASLEEAHAFKTMIHECAHALLHAFPFLPEGSFEQLLQERQELREIEAESVSFVVCSSLGLDSSEYSFQYIAGWKGQSDFFQESLVRIAETSRRILQAVCPDPASENGVQSVRASFSQPVILE